MASSGNSEASTGEARTFVKKLRNGELKTRVVTGPASEVAARFDGFEEEKPAGAAKPAAAKPASSSS